jgi:hypothetical protein
VVDEPAAAPQPNAFAELFQELQEALGERPASTHFSGAGRLPDREMREFSVPLRAGVGYLIMATCDGCTDVDIALREPGERLPMADVSPRRIARLEVTPPVTKSYLLQIELAGCAVRQCKFAYRAYRVRAAE